MAGLGLGHHYFVIDLDIIDHAAKKLLAARVLSVAK
jgi:hypothetical protein